MVEKQEQKNNHTASNLFLVYTQKMTRMLILHAIRVIINVVLSVVFFLYSWIRLSR